MSRFYASLPKKAASHAAAKRRGRADTEQPPPPPVPAGWVRCPDCEEPGPSLGANGKCWACKPSALDEERSLARDLEAIGGDPLGVGLERAGGCDDIARKYFEHSLKGWVVLTLDERLLKLRLTDHGRGRLRQAHLALGRAA